MPVYFTETGYKNYGKRIMELEERLQELQSQVQKASGNAGNSWHDNFEYEDLCRQIKMEDTRLNDAHKLLKNDVRIIEYPKDVERVVLGCEVKLSIDGNKETYQIVAYGDDDIDNNKITYSAPLAQAIMLAFPGDKVEAEFGNKNKSIEIIEVSSLNGKVKELSTY